MAGRVIFLDFDGVLNTISWVHQRISLNLRSDLDSICTPLDPVRCSRLQSLCDQTQAQIVFITGWRRHASTEALTQVLRAGGVTAQVNGSIGLVPQGLRAVGVLRTWFDHRAVITREWLENHPEVTHFVVLDDDSLMWRARLSKEQKPEDLDSWGLPLAVDTAWGRMPGWLGPRFICPHNGLEDVHVNSAVSVLANDQPLEGLSYETRPQRDSASRGVR